MDMSELDALRSAEKRELERTIRAREAGSFERSLTSPWVKAVPDRDDLAFGTVLGACFFSLVTIVGTGLL